jgi:phosphoglycerate dehydrogenase-like enzyme
LEESLILYFGEVPLEIREKLEESLPEGYVLEFYSDKESKEECHEALNRAEFILGFPRGLSREELVRCENLKMVQLLSAGYDYFDIDLASEMGVLVANNGGANAIAVAEHTIMMILANYKKLHRYEKALRKGVWYREEDHPLDLYELNGKQVGIIGLGNIGQALAKRLGHFGVDVKYYDIIRRGDMENALDIGFLEFENLLQTSDIVTVHVPLLDSTKNLIGERELNMMKEDAIIVNTARGGIIDEEALYNALQTRKIAGACLDVFNREKDIQEGTYTSPLLELDNIVITPHYAGHTHDTWHRRIRYGYSNIQNYARGKPKWIVNHL